MGANPDTAQENEARDLQEEHTGEQSGDSAIVNEHMENQVSNVAAQDAFQPTEDGMCVLSAWWCS